MEIDIYQMCPCQSGKKIKFCCGKTIVGDLARIVDLHKSHQLVAALEHIERTTARHGPADCMDALRIRILLEMGEVEKAEEQLEEFLVRSPESPIGHQHRAVALAMRGEFPEAIEAFQDAMDFLRSDEIPLALSNTLRELGAYLLEGGFVPSGLAHLRLSSRLFQDQEAQELVHRFMLEAVYPLVLKQSFALPSPASTPEAPWRAGYSKAESAAARGRWREALQRLQHLDSRYPDVPIILLGMMNLQVLLGRLAEAAAEGQRYVALADQPLDDRADVLALCLSIDGQELSETLEIPRIRFEIRDPAQFQERISIHPRILYETGSRVSALRSDDGEPLAGVGSILDRPADTAWTPDQPLPEELPANQAYFVVYGKRTDRPATVVINVNPPDQKESALALFREAAGDTIVEPGEESVESTTTLFESRLTSRWHFPRTMPRDLRTEFQVRHAVREMKDIFLHIPLIPLGGKTILEASQSPEPPRVVLAALISLLETARGGETLGPERNLGAELRAQAGLPAAEPITNWKPGTAESPLRMYRIDPQALETPILAGALMTAVMYGAAGLIRRFCLELLRREDGDQFCRRTDLYLNLAAVEPLGRDGLKWFAEARRSAAEGEIKLGEILIRELQYRIERDVIEGTHETLVEVEALCANDRELSLMLLNLLQRYGLLQRGTREISPVQDEPVGTAAGSSQIWLPESAPATGSRSGDSGLWLPD